MENINGKVVAITGAGTGIGRATAEYLAAAGAKVIIGARRKEQLQEVVNGIRSNNGEADFVEIDVTRRDDLVRLVASAIERFGRLDVLINNAGVAQLFPMEDLDLEGWEQMIDVNLKGTLYGIAAAMPEFLKQGSGHFINIISTAGIQIVPTMGVYAGTKNAIRTISEGLRQESNGRWRVTGISPGFIKTGFADQMRNETLKAQTKQRADEISIPAESIARAVAYAISQPDNVDVGDIVIRPTVQG